MVSQTTIYNPALHSLIALNPGDSPEVAIILKWHPRLDEVFQVFDTDGHCKLFKRTKYGFTSN